MAAIEWPAARVRSTFIDFFKSKDEKGGSDGGHTYWPSSGVVPFDDPTLLFTNAGMNQFKPIFMGTVDPKSPLAPLKRAANSQKCIRAGGKHNDLDDVGKDVYHHTFFEMLGNWSFASYFKKEAIAWAWELLTVVYGLPPERLYATYCEGDVHKGGIVEPDEETRSIWLQDDPNVLEIWNLVFIQMFRNKDQSLTMLPGKHVDTGMGMERITSILQAKMSNYDTDIFTPIFDAIQAKTGVRPYTGKVGKDDVDGVDMAYRVVADHIRTLTIAITDGALPGNEGRNYVIRRILRRGVRYAKQYLYPAGTSYQPGFFSGLTAKVVEILGDAFPELRSNAGTSMTPEKVAQVILEEEISFLRTLDKGISQFEKFAAEDKSSGKISGPHAFMLYDTFGFPVDLTVLMAEEKGLGVDKAGYEECMEQQRARSRGEGKEGDKVIVLEAEQTDRLAKELSVPPTDDLAKYTWVSKGSGPRLPATVKAIWDGKNFLQEAPEAELVGVVTDVTSFYPESGGQLFDTGKITTEDGTVFNVSNVQKFGAYILHIGTLGSGCVKVGGKVDMEVDYERRALCAANHTSTHLLNWALRKVLVGSTIDQRGSIVGPDKLRFDFSYGKPMKTEEIDQVQTLVRELIAAGCPVYRQEVALGAAKQVKSLRAVFGEVYPDPVRVVSVGPVPHSIDELLATPEREDWMRLSVEFCGGTHMDNTAEAATFAIVSEEGTAKGVRRITAFTREAAKAAQDAAADFEKRVQAAGEIADIAALDHEISAMRMDVDAITMDYVRKDGIKKAIDALKDRVLAAEKEQAKAKTEAAIKWAEGLSVGSVKYLVEVVDVDGDAKALDAAMKAINTRAPDLPVCLLSRSAKGDKVAGLAVVPPARAGAVDAKEWVNGALELCGGKGGGKPDRAMGAAKDASKFDAAVGAARAYAAAKLP